MKTYFFTDQYYRKTSREVLLDRLIKENSSFALANAFLDIYEECQALEEKMNSIGNTRPIAVTREEYDRICSLFKVRGIKLLEDGTTVKESRGRKPKVVSE